MNPYLLAVLTAAAGLALTRATWPFFSPTPFAPVFAAVAISTHWGHWRAGFLAILIAGAGAVLLFPTSGPQPWRPMTLVAFVVVSLVGCLAIAGRNRASAALQASESALRKTLDQLRASEEAVRQAHKLEAIGHLAAGVAHNFNNLLTVTMGYAEVLEDPSSSDDMRRTAMAEIRKATDRGSSLARQLLTFSRRHDARVARVPVDEAVLGLRDKFARVIREDTYLDIASDTRGADVLIDPLDLQQMLLNLVNNARDALPFGGQIHVEGAIETIDGTRGNPAIAPGTYVRLRVRDNGVGMSPEAQAHLFEPFFTTKEVGEGTGLGLPFVHGVAQHAGGFVVVQTEANQGTTVSVYLPPAPIVSRIDAGPAESAGASAAHKELGTILLVEDEDAVRRLTERLLAKAGYRILAAATPAEARSVFEAHRDELTILVTDVVMPEMHGPELANLFLARRPDLPVLFLSGYNDVMPAGAAPSAKIAFLAKPFSAAALTAAVESLLVAGDRR